MNSQDNQLGVAIIGMSGRFPQSPSVAKLWENLVCGRECLSAFSDDDIIASGVAPDIVARPDYVKIKGAVANIDCFDAPFFSISPREAELMDPQHRLLLECAWQAMEDAGYDPIGYPGDIGVFAGKSLSSYLMLNVLPTFKKVLSSGSLQAAIGNDKDSVTTQIAYHLNLTGPAVTVQTSSSTSLVAVCVAAQSLLTWQCDMALAGGVTLGPPTHSGYLAQEGGITSRDGHCRAFDAASSGFVPGTGLGLVVLKRLEDALRDGDNISAVIRGFAVNNDGAAKVSYTAPGVEAQARAIADAQRMAGISADDIGYVEAHGTGTRIGDPIEVAALTRAFRKTTSRRGFCGLGSIKPNIGHLDTAAGIAGLIKAALCVQNAQIPPSLNFQTPNPDCYLSNSPFTVIDELTPWRPENGLRRAGVTSLGMGGTNAHVILEQAPDTWERPALTPPYIFTFSARTEAALSRHLAQMADALAAGTNWRAQDVAFTLARGRRAMPWRAAVVADGLTEAAQTLLVPPAAAVALGEPKTKAPVLLMFSGQGSQYPGMSQELHERDSAFKEAFDAAAAEIAMAGGPKLHEWLFDAPRNAADAVALAQTEIAQPALFAVEYALARMWLNRSLEIAGMIGHSIGEWSAATVAGVFTLEQAARLVVLRGRLMASAPRGVMLSVRTDATAVQDVLHDGTELAARNAPGLCVLAGPETAIIATEASLANRGIKTERLRTSHAFHSTSMRQAAEGLRAAMQGLQLAPPQHPIFSTALGRLAEHYEICNPDYWSQQIVQPVRFEEAAIAAHAALKCDFLEIGPGNALATMATLCTRNAAMVLQSLPSANKAYGERRTDLETLSRLWVKGHDLNWEPILPQHACQRVSLPGYPFEKLRYWIESAEEHAGRAHRQTPELHPAKEKTLPIARSRKSPRPPLSTRFVSPEGKSEHQIAEIFEELLGIEGIGREDDFFEMGGHSLMASMALARLRDTFAVDIGIDVFFANATVAGLSSSVGDDDADAGALLMSLIDGIEDSRSAPRTSPSLQTAVMKEESGLS